MSFNLIVSLGSFLRMTLSKVLDGTVPAALTAQEADFYYLLDMLLFLALLILLSLGSMDDLICHTGSPFYHVFTCAKVHRWFFSSTYAPSASLSSVLIVEFHVPITVPKNCLHFHMLPPNEYGLLKPLQWKIFINVYRAPEVCWEPFHQDNEYKNNFPGACWYSLAFQCLTQC